MRFGERLRREAIAGWRYVNYDELKDVIQALVRGNSSSQGDRRNFSECLMVELVAVEMFFTEKQQEVGKKLQRLQNDLYNMECFIESGYPDVAEHLDRLIEKFTELGLEIAKLLQFLELNVTATRKIVKKYSHVTGHHAGSSILTGSEGETLERMSDPFELSEMAVAVQAGLERTRLLRASLKRMKEARRALQPPNNSTGSIPVQHQDHQQQAGAGTPRNSFRSDSENSTNATNYGSFTRNKVEHGKEIEETEYEANLTFRRFLASQLLASERTHRHLADEADLLSERIRRKPREAYLHSLSRLEKDGEIDNEMKRGLEKELEGPKSGQKLPIMYLLDDPQATPAMVILPVLALSSLYHTSIEAIAPFNLFYTEITGNPLGSSALSFATLWMSSWVCMFSLVSMTRKNLTLPVLGTCFSCLIGNLLYARVFSRYFEHGPDLNGPISSPAVLEERVTHEDFLLLASFALIGAAGFLGNILPALACARPQFTQAGRVERVAGLAVFNVFLGRIVGGAATTFATSLQFQSNHYGLGFLLNGLTVPALVIACLWALMIVVLLIPVFFGHLYRLCCLPARDFSMNDEVRIDVPSWRTYAGIASMMSASYTSFMGVNRPVSTTVDAISDWPMGLMLEAVASFSQRIVKCAIIVNMQMVFSANWSFIALICLATILIEIPVAYLTYILVRWQGSWFVLRLTLALSSFTACFLLPLNGIGTAFTLPRFLALGGFLMIFGFMLEFVTSFSLCRLFEKVPKNSPLQNYGVLGPILSVQAAQFFGNVLAYLLLALSLQDVFSDPTTVLLYSFGSIALLQTTLLIVVNWDSQD